MLGFLKAFYKSLVNLRMFSNNIWFLQSICWFLRVRCCYGINYSELYSVVQVLFEDYLAFFMDVILD
jgi:hypothetical protein